jgi:hypothetical protein
MSAVSEAICQKLQSDNSGSGNLMSLVSGVYPNIAPEGASYPLGIVAAQSPPIDDYTFGPTIAAQSSVYLVKFVVQDVSPIAAEDARARAFTVLQNAQLIIAGQTLLSLLRRSQFPEYSEQTNGLIYHHRGMLFDAITQ